MANENKNLITPDSLNPETPIDLMEAPKIDTPTIEGDMAYFNSLQQESQGQQELQAQQDTGKAELTNLLKDVAGLGTEQLALEQSQVNPIQAKVADYTGQANVLSAEFNKLVREREAKKARLEAEAGAKGITTNILVGQQGAVDRAYAADLNLKASEISILQAQALAEQGKADLAQRQIDRAIDLKYKSAEQEIAIKQFQLEQIKDRLTAEEKKQANSLNFALKKEEERIAEQKENAKTIEKMILDATPNAPADVIANANAVKDRGGSSLEVAQVLGKYGGDYLKSELLKEQIETQKATRAKISADTQKIKEEAKAGKPATQAQYTAAGFATRVESSKSIIDSLEEYVSGLSPAEFLYQKKTFNTLKSPEIQQLEQAQRNFVNAVLRRESGAAISPEEFKSAEQQYFPQPGDSHEVMAQKRENRNLTAQNLINESGSAYQSSEADNPFSAALGKESGSIPGTTIINKVNNDGSLDFSLPE